MITNSLILELLKSLLWQSIRRLIIVGPILLILIWNFLTISEMKNNTSLCIFCTNWIWEYINLRENWKANQDSENKNKQNFFLYLNLDQDFQEHNFIFPI